VVWFKHFHNPSFFFLWKLNSSLVLTSCSYVRFLSIAVQFPPTLHAATTQCTSVASLHVSIIFPLGRLVFYFQQSLKPNIKLSPILLTPLTAELQNCVCHSTVSPPHERIAFVGFLRQSAERSMGRVPIKEKEKSCLLRHLKQISLAYNAYSTHLVAPILLACLP
jgi:hypothetical protein